MAIPFFQQAIQKDPDFALAHAKLSVVMANVGRRDEARAAAAKAYELRDKVSEYERLYILWAYYTRVQIDDAKAKETLDVLTTTYPRDFAAKNNLGIYYSGKGKLEEAVAQYKAAHDDRAQRAAAGLQPGQRALQSRALRRGDEDGGSRDDAAADEPGRRPTAGCARTFSRTRARPRCARRP